MDARRRVDLQLRAITATYSHEAHRLDGEVMRGFRARARELLDGLDAEAVSFPDLEARIAQLRALFDGDESGGRGEEVVNRGD